MPHTIAIANVSCSHGCRNCIDRSSISVYREFGYCLCANKDNEFISLVCVGNGVGFAFLQPDFWRPPTRPGQNRKQVHMDGVALSLTHAHTCFLFCPQDRTDPYTHSTMGLPFSTWRGSSQSTTTRPDGQSDQVSWLTHRKRDRVATYDCNCERVL